MPPVPFDVAPWRQVTSATKHTVRTQHKSNLARDLSSMIIHQQDRRQLIIQLCWIVSTSLHTHWHKRSLLAIGTCVGM